VNICLVRLMPLDDASARSAYHGRVNVSSSRLVVVVVLRVDPRSFASRPTTRAIYLVPAVERFMIDRETDERTRQTRARRRRRRRRVEGARVTPSRRPRPRARIDRRRFHANSVVRPLSVTMRITFPRRDTVRVYVCAAECLQRQPS